MAARSRYPDPKRDGVEFLTLKALAAVGLGCQLIRMNELFRRAMIRAGYAPTDQDVSWSTPWAPVSGVEAGDGPFVLGLKPTFLFDAMLDAVNAEHHTGGIALFR